jgi:hypothetical protein
MPFEVDASGPVWRARFFDTLEVADLIKMAVDVAQLEAGREIIPPRITTLTQVAQFKVGYLEVTELARRRRASDPPNAYKSAIVAATPAQLGFARMYQTLLDHPKIHLEIFSEMHQAEAWIVS